MLFRHSIIEIWLFLINKKKWTEIRLRRAKRFLNYINVFENLITHLTTHAKDFPILFDAGPAHHLEGTSGVQPQRRPGVSRQVFPGGMFLYHNFNCSEELLLSVILDEWMEILSIILCESGESYCSLDNYV